MEKFSIAIKRFWRDFSLGLRPLFLSSCLACRVLISAQCPVWKFKLGQRFNPRPLSSTPPTGRGETDPPFYWISQFGAPERERKEERTVGIAPSDTTEVKIKGFPWTIFSLSRSVQDFPERAYGMRPETGKYSLLTNMSNTHTLNCQGIRTMFESIPHFPWLLCSQNGNS